MIKLKVSYQDPGELESLLDLVRPFLLSCRKAREQKGRYMRAYIFLKSFKSNN